MLQNLNTKILFILFIKILLICKSNCDNFGFPYIFQSDELPQELKYMPTIGNGHISFTIFSDTIYMNGIYNGKYGISHRARIPNYSNVDVNEKSLKYSNDKSWKINYSLNVRSGVFQITKENEDLKIIQLIYAHRYFNRVIVNEIYVSRLKYQGKIELDLIQKMKPKSEDFSFEPIEEKPKEELFNMYLEETHLNNTSDSFLILRGTTKIPEDERYQKENKPICAIWNKVPEKIFLSENENFKSLKFLISIDDNCAAAKKDLFDALNDERSLIKLHQDQWRKIWETFSIEVKGNLKLSQAIYASLFYLACALPSLSTNQVNNPFFGLSPTGLGRGGDNLLDYRGHNFWDTEIWMLPVVTQMNPEWTRQLLNYRHRMLSSAKDYATDTGYKGARFPWESAYTGREVTDPCCLIVARQQHHISADISYAFQHYFSLTHDKNWLVTEGCPVVSDIAKFWASRVQENKSTGYFDIKYVMGPDEDHSNVTNNVYTNVVANYALQFAVFANKICENVDQQEAKSWANIANKLKIVYDPVSNYHPQFEGYELGTTIKQADAILLGYPLLYPMNDLTRANDLEIYEAVTRSNGPAMTWAMHAINHIDIKDYEKAHELFNKSYQQYVKNPFQVWSETTGSGAVNFITGAGGFLQAIINGFGGVRVYLDRLEINSPKTAPKTEKLFINGIKYLGSTFNIKVSETEAFVKCTSLNQNAPLVLLDGTKLEIDIYNGFIYKITSKIIIRSKVINFQDWRGRK